MVSMLRTTLLCGTLIVAHAVVWNPPAAAQATAASLADFERDLAAMREPFDIPGMSAAIVEHGEIVWARGFGIAHRERSLAANADTIYHLASVTKPYAATVVLQLVDERRLELDQPVSTFGVSLDGIGPGARVLHLLSHTAAGTPGTAFHYDGNLYGRLTGIVERVTGRAFSAELTDRIIRRLGLARTGPNPRRIPGGPPPGIAPDRSFEYSGLDYKILEEPLAMGYRRSASGVMEPMPHPTYLFAAAGLVASAPDVARFSIALDRGVLLKDSTRTRAWTPGKLSSGTDFPYGLGWFVQTIGGKKIVWHFGHGAESSALLVKIPDRDVTFVLLANSEGLSRGLQLDEGDLLRSPFAKLFLNWVH
jgi:CubicO group peptidase (beta-lactamase class C family)